jgi:hypothetical protein
MIRRRHNVSIQYQTKVVIYDNEKAMQRGIAQMQKQGWEVVSTEALEREHGCAKTCLFALIFLPLALLGKKPQKYKVQYRRPMPSKE